MKNREPELRSYLEKLTHRYLNVKSMFKQLQSLCDWQSPSKIETFNLGGYFFQLAAYSLSRTILVELSMLLSEKEHRSVRKWLLKAKENTTSLNPTRHNSSFLNPERQLITPTEYRDIIDKQIAEIDKKSETIQRVKSHRDKAIAHLDQEYFDDPDAINKDYPLNYDDIGDLINILGQILKEHYSLLFETDIRLEILSEQNLSNVLQYARAFLRARQDIKLREIGFKPADYLD